MIFKKKKLFKALNLVVLLLVIISLVNINFSYANYKPIEIPISKFNLDKKGIVPKKIAYKKTNKKEVLIKKNKALFSKKTISKAKKLKKGKGWFALSNVDAKQRARRTIMLVNDNMLPPKRSRKSLYYNPPGWTINYRNGTFKSKS